MLYPRVALICITLLSCHTILKTSSHRLRLDISEWVDPACRIAIRHKATTNIQKRTHLHNAILNGNETQAQRLIDLAQQEEQDYKRKNPYNTKKRRCYVDAQDYQGQTALMKAASHGQVETVRKLLQAGADRFQVDCKGEMALHKATNLGVTNLLLGEHDRWGNLVYDPNKKNNKNRTALDEARRKKCPADMIAALAEHIRKM